MKKFAILTTVKMKNGRTTSETTRFDLDPDAAYSSVAFDVYEHDEPARPILKLSTSTNAEGCRTATYDPHFYAPTL